MSLRVYLLSIKEFLDEEDGGGLLGKAFSMVDAQRVRKAQAMKHLSSKAASLGAGLLLQLAVREALEGAAVEEAGCDSLSGCRTIWDPYCVTSLLQRMKGSAPLPLAYGYGERGKPYFKDLPFCFSLSHSGEYVLCALSREEVGADVQQHRGTFSRQVAARFFTAQELAALENGGEDEGKIFFRLWARKEAFGKLTGGGIMDGLGVNLLPGTRQILPEGEELCWEEYEKIAGYSIAVCCRERKQPV